MIDFIFLQLFAEGEAVGDMSVSTGDAATTSENVSESGVATGDGAEQTATAQDGESWDSLIKGKYKKEYDSGVRRAVTSRVKNLKTQIDTMTPAMQMVAQKYGINPDASGNIDYNALKNAIENDNSLYEDEAFQRGVPVSELKQMKALERENAQLKANVQQDRNQQMWNDVVAQSTQLKAMYPQFDLDTEMNDPQFGRMLVTLQNSGFKDALKIAYEQTHRDQINRDMMQYAVERTNQKISNSIQSGMRRPAENGSNSQSTASVTGVDVSQLSKKQIDDYVRRAKAGERITFQ